MDAVTLRGYQHDAIAGLAGLVRAGHKRVILQAQTGAGKTVMAAEIIRRAVEKGKRALFLAHARELIYQCSDKLNKFDVRHGIIMNGEGYNLSYPVQLASKDTYWARAVRRKKLADLQFDLVVCDEAHLSLAKVYRQIAESFENAVVIGLTATPARGDGQSLAGMYSGMIQAVKPSELIRQGYLVPTRVFAPYRPDLKGIKITTGGDYHKLQLEHRMNQSQLVGDIYLHWKKMAHDRQTIVFATGVQHSMAIRDVFLSHGVPAAHVDADTDLEERADTFRMLHSGDIQVLCNCNIATLGVDVPIVSCVVLAAPTRSIVQYKQRAGRIQRPFPGKLDAMLLDHSGCVYEHGFPDEDIEWQLEDGEAVKPKKESSPKDPVQKKQVTCKQCFCVYSGLPACPNCGLKLPTKQTVFTEGQLVEVRQGARYEPTMEDKQRFWHRCLAVMAHKNMKCTAAGAMYKRQFGEWPKSGLRNLPQNQEWHSKVREIFPQYLRKVTA